MRKIAKKDEEFEFIDLFNKPLPKFKDEYVLKFLRKKQELKDYEAFNLMHKHDGAFTKSSDGLSRL